MVDQSNEDRPLEQRVKDLEDRLNSIEAQNLQAQIFRIDLNVRELERLVVSRAIEQMVNSVTLTMLRSETEGNTTRQQTQRASNAMISHTVQASRRIFDGDTPSEVYEEFLHRVNNDPDLKPFRP